MPPFELFNLAVGGYIEEIADYLDDHNNKEALETLPASRDLVLSTHRTLVHDTMNDGTLSDLVKARLLGGWQENVLSGVNTKIITHPNIIKFTKGPWDEKSVDVDGTKELTDPLEDRIKQVLLIIHGAKQHPKRRGEEDDLIAAERIHVAFSTDLSYTLFRVYHAFDTDENEIEEIDLSTVTPHIPLNDTNTFDEENPLEENKRRSAFRFLLGKKASAFLGLDDDAPQAEDWDLDPEIDSQD